MAGWIFIFEINKSTAKETNNANKKLKSIKSATGFFLQWENLVDFSRGQLRNFRVSKVLCL